MKIVEISTRRRVTIGVFTVAVLLFGVVSLSRLNINLLPELSYPTLTIRTEYTGAAPMEVENLITKPVEEAVGVVKGVHTVRSVSRSGQSDVTLEFIWGTNMDFAGLEVREKLDALQLPIEVGRPVLLRFDPSLEPIMRFGLYKKATNDSTGGNPLRFVSTEANADLSPDKVNQLKTLRRYSDEQLKKQMESLKGVAAVKISGGFEEEIHVSIDEERLAQLNLGIDAVSRTLSAENVNLSGGRLKQGVQQYMVRTLNEFQTVSEIGDVIVGYANERPIYLHDVATIEQGYKEREAITRVNGVEAVDVAIYKEGDANTVAVAEAVKKRLEFIRNNLPADLALVQVYDQSVFIEQAVDEVVNAGIIGGFLAILVLYFFLKDVWITAIISMSIPVSVIATFNLMNSAELTLNIMSLGGIALGIGLLVDNSIVVLEAISRYREQGMSALKAAQKGASEVGTAVVASTLTTVAVFFPLVFVEGIAGQLFRDQALTVTFSLLASLLVAITLIPMLASIARDEEDHDEALAQPDVPKTWFSKANYFMFFWLPSKSLRLLKLTAATLFWVIYLPLRPLAWLFDKSYTLLEAGYPGLLAWALNHRLIIVFASLSLFAFSLWLVPKIGVELIPQMSQGELRVEFRLPPGTPLPQTDRAIRSVQEVARQASLINKTYSTAGTGNKMDVNPDEGGENWGEMNVVLTDGSGFDQEEDVIASLRQDLDLIPGLEYKFSRPVLFSFSTPVEIEVSGYDLANLKKVNDHLMKRLEGSKRFTDIKSTMKIGQPELQIHFDRERAAALGLNVNQIANRVVDKVRGTVATRYSMRERKVDVLVRAREDDRNTVQKVRELLINPESARPLPLSAVANVQVAYGPGEIHRRSQERVAIITTNLAFGDLGSAAQEIQNIFNETPKPLGISMRLAGQNEEMAASFSSLQFALILAVFLVYLVMASQFESLIHPFVILFTIPLAFIGAIFALYLTNSTISIIVFIGAIMLAGIVVNNAIVLIDQINQFRQAGMERVDAVMEAGRTRLRPIIMTTITTVLGLAPMALGLGEGSEIRTPMAITVIGGLVISTLLTLIVIPVIYTLVDRKKFKNQEISP